MQKKDMYLCGILYLAALVIFYPIFSAHYLYSDESTQVWEYRAGSGFRMFIDQGRLITEWLFIWLFGAAHTIADITFIRLFSFTGWLLCLPVWYFVIKKSIAKEQAYEWLPFFTCLYLVTSLPFAISVQWASCLELFLANTTGLLSGFLILKAIRFTDNKFRIAPLPAISGLAAGVVSMFTYQTATGCFLIPFLVCYTTGDTANKDKIAITGLAGFLLVYVCHFPLYKLSLWVGHIAHNDRTSIYISPMDKLQFFFSHPLERSFWFNAIINNESAMARALYKIMLVGYVV